MCVCVCVCVWMFSEERLVSVHYIICRYINRCVLGSFL